VAIPDFFIEFLGTADCQYSDVIKQNVDPAVGVQAFLDKTFHVFGPGYIRAKADCIAALAFNDVRGFAGSISAISTAKTLAPSLAKRTAVALPLPQPGPLEPAPITIAILSLSRPLMSVNAPAEPVA
jgi:hypothetical protein